MNDALSRREFLTVAGGLVSCSALGAASPAAGTNAPAPHEAMFYDKMGRKKVQCRLCPWNCVVPPGRRGQCNVRENRDGRYVSLVYGRPVAMHNDPIEKKPLFHVLPGSKTFSIATVGCNFHCKFCQNWDIAQRAPNTLPPRYMAPAAIAELAARHKSKTVAYTYNEPIVFYEYMLDCAKAAATLILSSCFSARWRLAGNKLA